MAENKTQIKVWPVPGGYNAEIRSGGLHVVTLPVYDSSEAAYESALAWLDELEDAYCICSSSAEPWPYRLYGEYVARHPRGEYILWEDGYIRTIPAAEVVKRYWAAVLYRWVDPDDPWLPPEEFDRNRLL